MVSGNEMDWEQPGPSYEELLALLKRKEEDIKRKEEDIKRKEEDIKRANARAKAEAANAKRKDQIIERKDRVIKRANVRADTETARADTEAAKTRPENLCEYLSGNFYDLMLSHKRVDATSYKTSGVTNVTGFRYSRKLCPWTDCEESLQVQFGKLIQTCGQRRLFPPSQEVKTRSDLVKDIVPGDEPADVYFARLALEVPVKCIVNAVLKNKKMSAEYNCGSIDFSDKNIDHTRSSSDMKGHPDGVVKGTLCARNGSGKTRTVFIYEYKAGHKIPAAELESILSNEDLFVDATKTVSQYTEVQKARLQRAEGGESTTSQDPEKASMMLSDPRVVVAKASTQVNAYMWQCGVSYGYLMAGDTLVLFHRRESEPDVLYYHQVQPRKHLSETLTTQLTEKQLFYTPVAQVACFCLLALLDKPLDDVEHEVLLRQTKDRVRLWPQPYLAAGDVVSAVSDERTRTSTRSLQTTESTVSHTQSCKGVSGVQSLGSKRPIMPPTKPYCTQACLLGLKRGWNLDENCPNVQYHRTPESGNRHPVDINAFTYLVKGQLDKDPYQYCHRLGGMHGGPAGRTGLLFKLELAQYGYTFVGKGSRIGHQATPEHEGDPKMLEHEGRIYWQLDRLQGVIVPVHLGLIHLDWGYLPLGEHRVWFMMLMSWAGEELWSKAASRIGKERLEAEAKLSIEAVWNEGVDHGDERPANKMWNAERGCVMVIDFDQALIRPRFRHKRSSETPENGSDPQRDNFDTNNTEHFPPLHNTQGRALLTS